MVEQMAKIAVATRVLVSGDKTTRTMPAATLSGKVTEVQPAAKFRLDLARDLA